MPSVTENRRRILLSVSKGYKNFKDMRPLDFRLAKTNTRARRASVLCRRDPGDADSGEFVKFVQRTATNLPERLLEIGDQVVFSFQSDRYAQQTRSDADARSLFQGHVVEEV